MCPSGAVSASHDSAFCNHLTGIRDGPVKKKYIGYLIKNIKFTHQGPSLVRIAWLFANY